MILCVGRHGEKNRVHIKDRVLITHLTTDNFFILNQYKYDEIQIRCTCDEIYTVLNFIKHCNPVDATIVMNKCKNKRQVLSLCNTDNNLRIHIQWDDGV